MEVKRMGKWNRLGEKEVVLAFDFIGGEQPFPPSSKCGVFFSSGCFWCFFCISA